MRKAFKKAIETPNLLELVDINVYNYGKASQVKNE